MLITIIFILFGLIVGSYLNVLIHRLPLEISTVTPRSACPSCKKLIRWYENIPVISFIILRGKCSNCGSKISIRYPLVEIATSAVAWLLIPSYISVNSTLFFLFHFAIFCCFLVHFLVDLKHQILPDQINLFLAILFLTYSLFFNSPQHWILGGLIGFGSTYGITWIFYKLKGQIGLGGGDIKLFGALGLYLGPLGILHNIFLSCMLGSVVGGLLILLKRMQKENPFPFGPFILIVAMLQIFFPKFTNNFLNMIM